MPTAHHDTPSGIAVIRAVVGRRIPVRAALVLSGALACAQPLQAADEYVSILFGTDKLPTQWLITGAGVTDAPATPVTIYPGFIGFSSTSFPGGDFIPGASQAAFDGAWNADFSFAIPRRAQNIRFQFYDLYADDRVVVLLNDSPIGDATFNSVTGTYLHQFGPGGDAAPFTFTETTQRTLLGDGSPLFIIGDKDPRGAENVLRLSVNNIVGGIPAPLGSTGDGTTVRMGAAISWTEDYQIRPYPNPQGNVVQVDDDPHGWYNAVTFVNSGGLVVDAGGSLTNRTGAILDNTGSIQNNGQITLGGEYSSLPYASFVNNGAMSVTGAMDEAGAFINTGSLGILGSGSFTYRGQGDGDVFVNSGLIYNQGKFMVTGERARFSGAGYNFTNTKDLLINGDAVFNSDVTNTGKVLIDAAVMGGELRNATFGEVRLSGGGGFDGGLSNEGSVYVDNGGIVASRGREIRNQNTIFVSSGSSVIIGDSSRLLNDAEDALLILSSGADLNVRSGGNLDNFAGLLDIQGSANVQGGLLNADNIGIGQGGKLRLGGQSWNAGNINVFDGSLLKVDSTGRVYGTADGAINLQPGSVMVVQGRMEDNAINCSGGRIMGSGTMAASTTKNLDGCTIGPGNSPGTLTMLGSLDLRSSTIELEIGSPDDYDRLVTDGLVQIDDTPVQVSFVDGYLADEMDSFAWLSGSNINGAGTLAYQGLPSGWTFQSSADGAGAQVSMASRDATDLGEGLVAQDVVNGAGQVAYVDRNESLGPEYSSIGLVDNSGAMHNREVSSFRNYGPFTIYGTAGTLLNRAGAWFVNRGRFINEFVASVQNSGTFYNHATGVLENQGDFVNAADGRLVNRGQITNGGGGSVFRNEGHVENRGEIVNGDVIENNGLFEIAAGAAVHGDGSGSTRYSQSGGETRVNGVLNADEIFILGGRLTGTGRVEGSVTLAETILADGITTGTIDPGDLLGTGTLGVTGSITLQGILHIDLASATLYDVLAVDGELIGTGLPATLEVALLGGYRPVLGDGFDYLAALNSGSFGQFTNMFLPTLDPDLAWATGYVNDGTLARYRIEVVAATVPAPGTLALLGTALATLVRVRVRRRGALS